MIISPHLKGGRVRVHLTNRFGGAPLGVAHATIAGAASGGDLAGGTLAELTFSGRRDVTIPAGADIVSDPVDETVLPFHKLAVSIAIRGLVAQPTEHLTTREVNYSTAPGSGDHTTDPGSGAFTPSGASGMSSGWYFLEGIDVASSPQVASVVSFGDSITDGFQGRISPLTEDLTTVGKDQRYPDFLQRRLDAAQIPLSVLNAGISGNRVLQDGQIPQFGPKALSRVNTDAIQQAGVRDVIVLEGINDIGQALPGGLTAQQLIDGYTQLIADLHSARLRVLLGTLTPAGGTLIPGYGITGDQIRGPVNQWIRTQNLADAVIDFDAAVRDPQDPSRLNPVYYGSDHLHFSAAGYQALANAIPLSQLSTSACGQSLTPRPGQTSGRGSRRRLTVKVTPRIFTVGRAKTIRVLVRADHLPVDHARVRLGRGVVFTNVRGVARLRVKFHKHGYRRITVSANGASASAVSIKIRKRARA